MSLFCTQVDIPLPDTKLLEQVRDTGYGSKVPITMQMHIEHTKYDVTGRCANADTYTDRSRCVVMHTCTVFSMGCMLQSVCIGIRVSTWLQQRAVYMKGMRVPTELLCTSVQHCVEAVCTCRCGGNNTATRHAGH